MERKIKVWHIAALGALIGAILVFFFIKMSVKIDRLTVVANQANEQVTMYSIMVDSLNETVSESALIIRLKESEVQVTAEQIARLKAENIKYLNAIGKLNLQMSAMRDSLEIKAPADTVIRFVEVVDDRPMIEVPLDFYYNDKWISMYGNVDINGKGTLATVLGNTPIDLALGSKLFKRDYVSAISSPNPYIQFDQVDIQLVAPSKVKPYLIIGGVSFSVGVLGGALLYHQLSK